MLHGAARQTRPARHIVVSCDNDHQEIGQLVRACVDEFGVPVVLVQRPHQGASRSAQVRNNGVRALLAIGADPASRLIFLDGDCCPAGDCFAAHDRLGARAELVIGFRIDLTPPQTEAFDEAAMDAGRAPVAVTAEQQSELEQRARRYERHALLRRFGLFKAHKPKLLSANFSIDGATFARINGFDEEYIGYGGEDDDFGRRVYRARARPVIGVREAVVYHLWHPTRAASAWEDSPGIARFQATTPNHARFGLDRPFAQPRPLVTRLAPGASPELLPSAPELCVR